MQSLSAARKAAFGILMAVERGQSHSDDLLRGKSVNSLSAPDRHLATALVLGTLRWQIKLDQPLKSHLDKPGAKVDREVLIALRLGAFQILHMDRIPARAAIDESVELAKHAGHRFASGMVNAVLRKLANTPRAGFAEDSPAKLALAQAHPTWMVERWASFYGFEAARAICRRGQSQPVSSIRLANPAVESELIEAGVHLEPGELLTAARIVTSGDITATAAFNEGRLRLQDEGSQLVAELAGQGDAILDCCAAPGGKSLILAERNPEARIVACESSSTRFDPLRQRLATHAAHIECRQADATKLTEQAVFDLALADVPCSGTGTLGRNPEIRHRLRLEDLPVQAGRQRELLRAALRAVRPGGRVVYSTCSLEPEENEQVVAAILAECPNVRGVSLRYTIENLLGKSVLVPGAADRVYQCLTPEGALRLLPGFFRTDGFFIVMIEKTA